MRSLPGLFLLALVCCDPGRARVESPKGPGGAAYEARGFDRASAAAALGSVEVQGCKAAGTPTGVGHVRVLFGADGAVTEATLDDATPDRELNPFIGTTAEACIVERFKAARMKPFADGPPLPVGRSFTIR